MDKSGMRRRMISRVFELLAERGLLNSMEKNALKTTMELTRMQGPVPFGGGEEIGKGGNL